MTGGTGASAGEADLRCRACARPGRAADVVLDLGAVPAGDDFPAPDAPAPDPCFPLAMWCCRSCGLVQLLRDDTAVQEPRAVEPRALRQQAAEALRLVSASGLLDDVPRTAREFPSPHGGSWLGELGWPLAGPDEQAGLVLDTFSIMHEADQAGAIAERAARLAPEGVLLVQVHSLEAIVAGRQWNALRHGHVAYYSLTSLAALLSQAGLEVVAVWEFALYGKTLLVGARHRAGPGLWPDPTTTAVLDRESRLGLDDPAALRVLQTAADEESAALRRWLRANRRRGRRVYGYGAASRAAALLDRAGVDAGLLLGVADASPAKQGRSLPTSKVRPGGRVPIVSPAELVAAAPDAVLLLLDDLQAEVADAWPALAGRLVRSADVLRDDGSAPVPVLVPDGLGRRSFARSTAWQQRLHELVPGGAHTYARAADQYPEQMAPVIERGLGARVWDVDGNSFVEYGMGLRAVTLGHAYPPVVEAVCAAAARGTSFSRPAALEASAAEDFLALVPGADMVKFAKNGSDATTAAVKLARAATGRDVIAMADHPFFSTDDWFIATTPMSSGIPASASSLTERFRYNDLDSLRAVFERRPGAVAAVVMEAATAMAEPAPGYLAAVRALCDRHGTVLVFDEMITGFRWAAGGAQQVYGVVPDLSCWGKAMGNGFPISALAGKRELMELGGLRTDRDRVFLLSTTHGPETTGLAAFRAVARVYREQDPVAVMEAAGSQLVTGVAEVVAAAGLGEYVGTAGRSSCLVYWTKDPAGEPSQAYRTVLMQGLLDHGVLGQSFVVSAAHGDAEIDATLLGVERALVDYRRAVDAGRADVVLRGRPVAPALRRRAYPREEPAPAPRDDGSAG